jgi:hypothetical protein
LPSPAVNCGVGINLVNISYVKERIEVTTFKGLRAVFS